MAATIRISDQGHRVLSQLALEAELSMIQVLDAALENYRRQRFLEQANAAYAAIQSDPASDAAFRAELATLDGTGADGLNDYKP